jgi:hypothetical protein
MAAATARYNERIAAFNAAGGEGNGKDIADAEYKAIVDAIKAYEESNKIYQEKIDQEKKLV